jgi:hypothetical protein
MAFKARGLAEIQIQDRGRVVERRPANPAENGGGTAVMVGGVQFTHRLEKYQGEPSTEMLAANNLDIRTLKGRPYPGSATDRFCKAAPDSAPKVNHFGQDSRLAGPNSMRMDRLEGRWPDPEEKQANAIREARFRDNSAVTRALALARGMKPEEAEALASRAAAPGSMEHLAAVAEAAIAPPPKGKPKSDDKSADKPAASQGVL